MIEKQYNNIRGFNISQKSKEKAWSQLCTKYTFKMSAIFNQTYFYGFLKR